MGMDKAKSSCHLFASMILIPTIELRDQKAQPTLAADLQEKAETLIRIGFEHLYIIDRDAQYSDKPFNIGQVRSFLSQFADYKIGVGGGIKDMATLDAIVDAGAKRVILGPMFWRQAGLFAEAAKKYPEKLFTIIDAYEGWVRDNVHQTEPHTSDQQGQRILDVALQLEAEGAAAIIYLERERSGFYGGIDAETMADLAFALQVPLYVTGGINSLDHLRALKSQADTGIRGAILGRALLDGRIDPVSALALLKQKDD